jgi:hypothetical protein
MAIVLPVHRRLQKEFKALVFWVDRSSHRALGVAYEGADSGSSATWSGSRSSASPVESISCRNRLGVFASEAVIDPGDASRSRYLGNEGDSALF